MLVNENIKKLSELVFPILVSWARERDEGALALFRMRSIRNKRKLIHICRVFISYCLFLSVFFVAEFYVIFAGDYLEN